MEYERIILFISMNPTGDNVDVTSPKTPIDPPKSERIHPAVKKIGL